MSLDLHAAPASPAPAPPRAPLGADELLDLARACGADDCGLVSIDESALAEERPHIARAFPSTRTLLALVLRMNREPVRSPARSVANLEFHRVGHEIDDVARRIVRRLEDRGVRALNPAMAFPMEMERFPRARLDRLAQAGRRSRGSRQDGHPPKPHSPEIRQLRLARC